MKKLKRLIFGALIFAVSVLLLLEVSLRVLALFPGRSDLFTPDPQIGYRAAAGVDIRGWRTNSSGFNDIEHQKENGSGHCRVAIIGDSFVFGVVPRNENFVSLIQDHADLSAKNIEVFNMGLIGAGPQQYLDILSVDAMKWRVDVVVAVVFIGNDIVQSHRDFQTRIRLGTPNAVLRQPYLIGSSLEYSYVYRLYRSISRTLANRSHRSPGSFSEAAYLSIEKQRSRIFLKNPPRWIRQCYRAVIDRITEMAAAASTNGMSFWVVLAPDEIQVNRTLQESLADRYRLDLNHYDFQRPQDFLAAELAARVIPYIDLLESLRSAGLAEPVYELRDTHWNALGNRVAATTIWETLASSPFFCGE